MRKKFNTVANELASLESKNISNYYYYPEGVSMMNEVYH